MFNLIQILDIALLVVLAVLIYRNKAWENQPMFIVSFIVILLVFVYMTLFM